MIDSAMRCLARLCAAAMSGHWPLSSCALNGRVGATIFCGTFKAPPTPARRRRYTPTEDMVGARQRLGFACVHSSDAVADAALRSIAGGVVSRLVADGAEPCVPERQVLDALMAGLTAAWESSGRCTLMASVRRYWVERVSAGLAAAHDNGLTASLSGDHGTRREPLCRTTSRRKELRERLYSNGCIPPPPPFQNSGGLL